MDFKDFKSSCRALTTSEVGSIPTRSRHLAAGRSWVGSLLLGLAMAARPVAAEEPLARPVEPGKERSGASPATTLLRSIAFPGWGQLENDRPFKAAAVFAVEAGLLASGYVEYRRSERSREDEQAAAQRGDAAAAGEEFQRYVDRRGRAVNRFWLATFTVMMSMIDAYTDAHLRDFVPAPVPVLPPEDASRSLAPPADLRLGLEMRF